MAPRPDLDAVPRQSASRSPATATATAARPQPAIARSYSAKNARHSAASPRSASPSDASSRSASISARPPTPHPPSPYSQAQPSAAQRSATGGDFGRPPAPDAWAAFRDLSAWNRASGDLASNSRPQSGHAHTSITTSPAHSHRLAMLRHGTDALS